MIQAQSATLHKSRNEDGFNIPNWVANFSVSNTNIYKNRGATVSFKWQNSCYWQSFFINGNVPAFSTVDAQLSYKFEKQGLS